MEIPKEIKSLYPEICCEMLQVDPLLIEKMPEEILTNEQELLELVRKRPETLKIDNAEFIIAYLR